MKTLKALGTKILTVLLLLPALASAAPLLINYQGRLVDTAGNPLVGTQSILFSVYDAASAGSLLWSETQSVTPDNGIFSVSLGGVSALPASVFASDALYLEVKIGADAPLAPRTRLLSVPYALSAANLGSPSSFVTVSTHIVVAASQLRLGNYAAAPASAIGNGAMFYNSSDNLLYYYNGTAWTGLAAGGLSPWGRSGTTVSLNTAGDKVTMSNTGADALTVSGGITAGSGSVGIIGADGRIPALSSTYLANLSGAALTGLSASQVGLGSVDNTADTAKPVSTLQQAALDLKANSADVLSNNAAIPQNLVNLSTVTAELDGKLANNATVSPLLIDLSTVTSALALKADTSAVLPNDATVSTLLIDLSTVTAALDGKLANNATVSPLLIDLSTVTSVLALKADTSAVLPNDATVSTLLIDLSTVTAALDGKLANNATVSPLLIDLSTVTSVLALKADTSAVLSNNVTVPATLVDLSTVTTALAGKQATGDYITSLTGPITASGPGAAATTITAGAVGTTHLADGGVTKAKLAVEAGCDAGDILKVAGGVWTCDLDAGAAAGVSGTGVANQVSFWDGASSITGDADLTFNSATGILTATGFAGNLAGNAANITGDLAAAQIAAGDLPADVFATAVKTGNYLNDVKVSSAIYADGANNASTAGNADTATALATARLINGESFDGTADITVPVNSTDDNDSVGTRYVLWTSGEGDLNAGISTTKLTFSPNTGVLSATGFAGNLTGEASSVANDAITTSKILDANVTASKLAADVAGNGISSNTVSGALEVNVDNSSIELSNEKLQVKALGITNGMLAGSIDQSKVTNLTTDLAAKADLAGATFTGMLGLYPRTIAELNAITPTAVGQLYFCSDCTASKVVVSTGTLQAEFGGVSGGNFE